MPVEHMMSATIAAAAAVLDPPVIAVATAVGYATPAVVRCAELCDAAEGGETFPSPVTAGLLEGERLGNWSLHDRGAVRTRRGDGVVRPYELLAGRTSTSNDIPEH